MSGRETNSNNLLSRVESLVVVSGGGILSLFLAKEAVRGREFIFDLVLVPDVLRQRRRRMEATARSQQENVGSPELADALEGIGEADDGCSALVGKAKELELALNLLEGAESLQAGLDLLLMHGWGWWMEEPLADAKMLDERGVANNGETLQVGWFDAKT
jgi:hypothetical protein